MYLEYWEFDKKPFENTPDPAFLYPSEQHTDCLQKLLYATREGKGCVLLTGEYGCGKTVLMRAVIEKLGLNDYDVGFINYPIFTKGGFLKEVLYQFGEEKKRATRSELFRSLSQVFFENVNRNKGNILVIDEAQLLDKPVVFEELRLLLNIQLEDRFLVTLFLVGQPELREKVLEYPQLEQRIAIKLHLHHFDLQDSMDYIQYRIKTAGGKAGIFPKSTATAIFKICNGIPRRINNLCDLCLLEGMAQKADKITEEIIRSVA